MLKKYKNIRIPAAKSEWEPWDKYFPGAPENNGDHGGWVNVLRKPDETDSGWTFLFKWVGHPEHKVRVSAHVPEDSNEEVYVIEGDFRGFDSGDYVFHGRGAPHVAVFDRDFVAVLHFDGGPDIIDSYEYEPLDSAASKV